MPGSKINDVIPTSCFTVVDDTETQCGCGGALLNIAYDPATDGAKTIADPNATAGEKLMAVPTILATLPSPSGGGSKIHMGKQGKHIVGHNNYLPGRSILKSDPQKLLDDFNAGKSSQVINGEKTRVNFGEEIGDFVKDGVATPTPMELFTIPVKGHILFHHLRSPK